MKRLSNGARVDSVVTKRFKIPRPSTIENSNRAINSVINPFNQLKELLLAMDQVEQLICLLSSKHHGNKRDDSSGISKVKVYFALLGKYIHPAVIPIGHQSVFQQRKNIPLAQTTKVKWLNMSDLIPDNSIWRVLE